MSARTSNRLHRQAMDMAALADANPKKRKKRLRKALALEIKAAQALTKPVEPTTSILWRSVASLALECKLYQDAIRVATSALTNGSPPPEIAEELADIINAANNAFEEHKRRNA